MYFMPKTKMGKWAFWVVVISFVLLYMNYLMSIFGYNIRTPVPGLFFMVLILLCGALSFISIIKYKDKSMALIITSIIGLLIVIAEIVFPH